MARAEINIEELNLEELKKVSDNAEEAHKNCSGTPCSKCYSDKHNFTEIFKGSDCGAIRGALRAIVKILEREHSEVPKCSGKCESCKNISREYFEKSGYLFCSHWHNFTVKDGFCYAFEGVENS